MSLPHPQFDKFHLLFFELRYLIDLRMMLCLFSLYRLVSPSLTAPTDTVSFLLINSYFVDAPECWGIPPLFQPFRFFYSEGRR